MNRVFRKGQHPVSVYAKDGEIILEITDVDLGEGITLESLKSIFNLEEAETFETRLKREIEHAKQQREDRYSPKRYRTDEEPCPHE